MSNLHSREVIDAEELATFLPAVCDSNSTKTAMVWPDRNITYSELETKTSKIASAIQKAGLNRGDRVGGFLVNSPEMVFIWLGTLRAGCTFVPYNSALKGDILSFQLIDSKPKLLFVDRQLVNYLPEDCFGMIRIIENNNQEKKLEQLSEFIDSGDENQAPVRVGRLDPACIMYTSGTTGSPRGIILPHFAFVNRVNEIFQIIDLEHNDIFYNTLPFFHTSGQVMTTLPALMTGRTVIQDNWFHASRFWKFAAAHKATITFILMRMINAILATEEENYFQNDLRAIMCGGVKEELMTLFEKRFNVPLIEGFGMTETCGIAIFNFLNGKRAGSIGKPLPSVRVKLCDNSGNPVASGEIGEIFLKNRIEGTFLTGYLNNSQSPLTEDGWLATGDLAKEIEGFYYYIERKKDIIRSREENVLPYQIENAVETHPNVLESAAVGVNSSTGDEEILLALKLKEKIEPIEILMFLEKKLPFFMVPRYLLFLEEIPKTPNQKIKRQLIREMGLKDAVDAKDIGFKAKRPLA